MSTETKEDRESDKLALRVAAMESEIAELRDSVWSWRNLAEAKRDQCEDLRKVIAGGDQQLAELRVYIEGLKAAGTFRERALPGSDDLERELLGGLLLWTDEGAWCYEWMQSEDFRGPWHAWLYRCLKEAHAVGLPLGYERGGPGSLITEWVIDHANKAQSAGELNGCIERKRIPYELAVLYEKAQPTRDYMRFAAKRLRELRRKRECVLATFALIEVADDSSKTADDWLSAVEAARVDFASKNLV
jgi:hypothetical protein